MMIVAGAMAALIAASAVAGLKACATYDSYVPAVAQGFSPADDAYLTDVAQGFSPADDSRAADVAQGFSPADDSSVPDVAAQGFSPADDSRMADVAQGFSPADGSYLTGVAQGFSPADDASSPKLRVGWAEFKKQYDDGKIVVVDVRDAGSYEAGHIARAWSVPLDAIEKRAGELKKLKKPIVTYCA